jgi:hypothetical protein
MKKIKLAIIALVAITLSATVWAGQEASQKEDKTRQLEAELARDPNNLKLIQRLGWTYFYQARKGDGRALDKAIAAFERGAALAPQDSEFPAALGISNFIRRWNSYSSTRLRNGASRLQSQPSPSWPSSVSPTCL